MLASPLLKGSALMGELFGSAAPAETADPMMDVINVFVFEKLAKTTVGVARPYLWGLSCFGQRGVSRILELLRVELAVDMGLAGVARISDIDRNLVRIRNWGD